MELHKLTATRGNSYDVEVIHTTSDDDIEQMVHEQFMAWRKGTPEDSGHVVTYEDGEPWTIHDPDGRLIWTTGDWEIGMIYDDDVVYAIVQFSDFAHRLSYLGRYNKDNFKFKTSKT